jgi:tRNA threonylcarbamoyladenosine biosynthesis protein TsaB
MTGVWLGIETTSMGGGVALVSPGKLLAETYLPVDVVHSEKILPAISAIFDSTGLTPESLTGIGVSLGPGSYTGLRIGVSTAAGLSSGLGVPLKGVGTLRVIASCTFPEEPVLACIKARTGEVYAALYSGGGALSEVLIRPGVYRTEGLIQRLEKDFIGVLAVGSGRSEMPDAPVRWLPAVLDSPRPSIAALLASAAAVEEGFDQEIEPLYLRNWNQGAARIDS